MTLKENVVEKLCNRKNSILFGFSLAYSYLCTHDDGMAKTDIEQKAWAGAPTCGAAR